MKRYRSAVDGKYVTEAEAKADPERTVSESVPAGRPTNTRRAAMSDSYADAFNKWMDDYVNDPEAYRALADIAEQHMRERLDGGEPTYGDVQAATFREYLKAV